MAQTPMNLLVQPVAALGSRLIAFLEFAGGIGYLLLDTLRAVPRGLIAKRGRRLAWQNLWAQMVRVGVRSIPIVMLVLFCIGSILALQMAPVLREYGATEETANIISIAVFREMGPLVSAIVLTGFAGASIAAEIGSMVVSEEIEAMEAEAISPIRFLVLPRILGTMVMMTCVAVVGDLTGVIGGGIVARYFLGVSSIQYFHRTFEAVRVHDFLSGLVKATVFGVLISGLACFLGLRVTGGAQGVGAATTRTVVLTIVALITVDLMFTSMFYLYGW
jgi:phospholipid/cholesterol/gamma-HCH transport system permease protein